jgi:carbonic anhydrase
MTLLDSILVNNRQLVQPGTFMPLMENPKKQFALFTSIDSSLIEFLEPAMGIKQGDASIIRNSSNNGLELLNEGAIQSLVAAIFIHGVEEILVVGHDDPGNTAINPEQLKNEMVARGISSEAIKSVLADLLQSHTAPGCLKENTTEVVREIRAHPLIPADVPVHGLIFSDAYGHIEIVVDGYEAEGYKSVNK